MVSRCFDQMFDQLVHYLQQQQSAVQDCGACVCDTQSQ
jgi:hypothetical protein